MHDLKGSKIPEIIVEVCLAQSNRDLILLPAVNFAQPGVQVVFLIHLIKSRDANGQHMFTQMIAILYERAAEGGTQGIASRAISFGRLLHPATASAIIIRSGINPAHFTGTGRHGERRQCTPDHDLFSLPVLSAVQVWDGGSSRSRTYCTCCCCQY